MRQEGQTKEVRAIAFKAQERLHGRFRLMTGRHKKVVVVVAALARELCGFVWAIACQVSAPEKLKRGDKGTACKAKILSRVCFGPSDQTVMTVGSSRSTKVLTPCIL